VVGIVTKVSARHARVMSLCHADFRLSAQLRGKHYFGSLRWLTGDTRTAKLSAIPKYAPVAIGDTVETTGYSNIFPTGIPIGVVQEVEPAAGETTYDITVGLFVDFFELEHAYVVRDLMKEDLEQLDN
ncbi:MAG: rod shape-determining protein MreC, partial [Bacteroidetes bacterium]